MTLAPVGDCGSAAVDAADDDASIPSFRSPFETLPSCAKARVGDCADGGRLVAQAGGVDVGACRGDAAGAARQRRPPRLGPGALDGHEDAPNRARPRPNGRIHAIGTPPANEENWQRERAPPAPKETPAAVTGTGSRCRSVKRLTIPVGDARAIDPRLVPAPLVRSPRRRARHAETDQVLPRRP